MDNTGCDEKSRCLSKCHTGDKNGWVVYILECSDLSLYTGITNNLTGRIENHRTGKGARYTRGRGPLKLVYVESFENRSGASKREFAIKKLSRREKLELIACK